MEDRIIDRIKAIIAYKGVNPRSFAAAIGFNYSTLNNYLTGRRNTIDSRLLSLIASTYDDISSAWLLTGQGSMAVEKQDPVFSAQYVQQLEEELEKTKEAMYMLKGKNELLEHLVETTYQARKA